MGCNRLENPKEKSHTVWVCQQKLPRRMHGLKDIQKMEGSRERTFQGKEKIVLEKEYVPENI